MAPGSTGTAPRFASVARRLALPLRWFGLRLAREDIYPRLEFALGAIAIIVGLTSYVILTGKGAPAVGFSPPMVTLLIVANLLPLMALIVLIARRVAILLMKRRERQAGAKLHFRLVALFSFIAAVPTLLVVVFASMLFQFGVQFWFSDQVRTVLGNADQVAQAYVQENKQRIIGDIIAMSVDLDGYAADYGISSDRFAEGLAWQVAARNLNEASVFSPSPNGLLTYASVGITSDTLADRVMLLNLDRAKAGEARVIASGRDRVEAVVRLDPVFERYVYVSRKVDPQVLNQVARTQNALSTYKLLTERSAGLQWRFNAMLMVVSLLILAAAISFALWLANRLVGPIGTLVGAAERVGAGDFSVRVPLRGNLDEIGVLAGSFNRMTTQLDAQKKALVAANEQLDRRRQFTEAVLSGVSAGVLSVDARGVIRLSNRSATELLETSEADLVGTSLSRSVPELAAFLEEVVGREVAGAQVRIARGAETQTLAVRVVAEASEPGGYVITFDDISQQLADQRRAAWADVARRIAHEIKNPLTPIQLAAERLQRRFGRQISEDAETFAGLTGTIVRQVGDLRRMVDEFSSFARMPKPEFRPEPVLDIARQALLLQTVAYPSIDFSLDAPDTLPLLVCDRRQIAQALTNLLKNAAEAVQARFERESGEGDMPAGQPQGAIGLAIAVGADRLDITVADNGIGLPDELRDRLTEPYVTTRQRGTGLGLAIVKKIVEEHDGTLELSDRDGGGTIARLTFDTAALGSRVQALSEAEQPQPVATASPRRRQG